MIANCRTTVDLLAALVDGALSAEEDAALAAHFADCPRCVEFLASYRATSRIIREAIKVDLPADIEERLLGFLVSQSPGPV
jgi:anti-sigma factor RsiW